MKKFTWLLLCMMSIVVLAACGNNDKEEASTNTSTTKELTVGVPKDFGPVNIYTENEDWLNDMIYDKLMAASPYVDEPTPWLAEKVTKIDDTNWEVVVRDGIKWQDGEEFTAEDVKFTYEYYRDGPQTRYTHHVNEVPDITTIDIKEDGKTIAFECSYACPQLDTITFADLPILPQHIWKDVENPRKFTDLAIGTGPYKLTEYKEGSHYKVEANKDYFKGEPTVETINMPIIGDSTAMFNALKSGEIDISKRTVPTELQQSLLSSNFKLAQASALSIVELGLNFKKEPFKEGDFRQAISQAIDKDALVKTVGAGISGTEGYPHKDSPWTNPDNEQPYDQATAIKTLNELGYTDTDKDGFREDKDGNKLEFKLIVSGSEPIYVRVAELVKNQLKEVGIAVNVKSSDAMTFAADTAEKNYDMYVSLIGPHGAADPDQFIMSNRSGYLWAVDMPYAEMDKLQDEWQAANTAEARKAVSFDMQTLFNSQPTSVSLYYPEDVYAYNTNSYSGYVEALGYGIINKYSFLSKEVQEEVSATEPNYLKK